MPKDKRNRLTRFISDHGPQDGKAKEYRERLERMTNSKLMTKTIERVSGADDISSLSTQSTKAKSLAKNRSMMKSIMSRINAPSTLESLPPGDVESAFNDLSNLPGFEKCKGDLLRLKKAIELWRKQGVDLEEKCTRLHAAIFSKEEDIAIDFAKHYHAFLSACGVITAEQSLVQASGDSHKSMWSLDVIDGGMCLVLNAKDLSFHAAKDLVSRTGTQNVVIVASYTGVGEELHSSLKKEQFILHLQLIDETEKKDPLTKIQEYVESLMTKDGTRPISLEGGFKGTYAGTFAKRIIDGAKDKDEDEKKTNARVEKEIKIVFDRQHTRLLEQESDNAEVDPSSVITKEDLLGAEPTANTFNTQAWKDLQNMVGLEEVKTAVKSFANGVLLDYHRGLHGHAPARSGLSRLFIGPPGTGKTTVGKLYGQILSDLNLLTKGEFMYKKASDFIGTHIGKSEKLTRKILKEAQGKVLMIDEAYMLDPTRNRPESTGADPYRQAVLDTIVGEVQNSRDEDICVILAGYKDSMEHMLDYANPGLKRRFPMDGAFVFEEFTAEQLEEVLKIKMEKDDLTMTDEAKQVAMGMLELAKQRENFGNGGEVDNLLGRALANYRTRFSNMAQEQRRNAGEICFLPEDFDPDWDQIYRTGEKVERLFDGLEGIDDVKDRFVSLTNRATSLRENGHDPVAFMPFYFAFKGPRGTGKTIVAGKMGWLFHAMRLIPTEEVVQKSASNLIGKGSGGGLSAALGSKSSGSSCLQLMESALGKVLVIHDAHRLVGDKNDQTDMVIRETRQELIDALNQPKFAKKLVVILTGYGKPLERMLNENPGLGSKFSSRLQFHSLTSDACLDILLKQLQEEGVTIELSLDEKQEIESAFEILGRSDEWANRQDVQLIAQELTGDAFGRQSQEESAPTVTGSGILQSLRNKFPRQLARLPARDKPKPADVEAKPEVTETHTAFQQSAEVTNGIGLVESPAPQEALQQQMSISGGSMDSSLSINSLYADYEYRKLPGPKYTRVIRLQPAHDFDSPIECTLQEISLDDVAEQRGRFDAISYVWETQEKTHQVFCDGKTLRVTRNADLALRHLRHKKSPSRLWIDAISISQESKAERNLQVPLMGDIYKAAMHVYIWMGAGTVEATTALAGIQKLCCLTGEWSEHEEVRRMLFAKYRSTTEQVIALDTLMKHGWWKRMWTFQEFVLSRRPTFVVGYTKIPWKLFREIMPNLVFDTSSPEENRQMQAKKTSAIGQLLPNDFGHAADVEASTHMLPHWVEATEATTCRTAYEQLQLEPQPKFMSYFLFKIRNRETSELRDKVFAIHSLFRVSGYDLPDIDYNKNVEEIYTGAALALLQQSQSWWMLSHLLNKREVSSMVLPSWVPDFSSPAAWHQRAGLRSHNINKLERDIERQEAIASRLTSIPFRLDEVEGGLMTQAVFLWTVTKASAGMPSSKVLDRSFDEHFEQTDFGILQEALEDFLFHLAGWLTTMEPAEDSVKSQSPSVDGTKPEDIDAAYLESQTLKAIAFAFGVGQISAAQVESLGLQAREGLEEREDADDPDIVEARETVDEMQEQAPVMQTESLNFLMKALGNCRGCIYPDETHPCKICGVPEGGHASGEGAEHYTEWLFAQGFNRLSDVRYALYSRAVDHSLFRTNSSERCGGHFGFCRNQPKPGDEIVLLPGLSDPVIIRRDRRQGDNCFRIIGVTTGLVRPGLLDETQHEVEGAYCFGTCGELANAEDRDVREFYLV